MPAPRILVTRAPHQASALAVKLRELGAEPLLIPTIETMDPTSFAALDEALDHLTSFHWLIFTSANAVKAYQSRLLALRGTGFISSAETTAKKDVSASEGNRPRIAVIGPSTAETLDMIGLSADITPSKAIAESLTEVLLPHVHQPNGSPTRFLLIRAEEAREYLPETLRAAGAEVTIAPAYRTVIPQGAAEQLHRLFASGQVDAITFTSSSTARNLFALLEAGSLTLPPETIRASIGPITSATLSELGFPPHIEAPQSTVQSLAETVVKYLRTQEQG